MGLLFCDLRCLQVYRHDSGSGTFLCRNKYFGRGLTTDGFRKTLQEFFYNGYRTRRDVIRPIIEKLRSLIKRLNQLPSYRFYSSSLLIMYDGVSETNSDEDDVEELHHSSNHKDVSVSKAQRNHALLFY